MLTKHFRSELFDDSVLLKWKVRCPRSKRFYFPSGAEFFSLFHLPSWNNPHGVTTYTSKIIPHHHRHLFHSKNVCPLLFLTPVFIYSITRKLFQWEIDFSLYVFLLSELTFCSVVKRLSAPGLRQREVSIVYFQIRTPM
jgi:hypothetical protein